jgi:hypothetical protein
MPIYEYQGQQYDIATEDRAEAKAKILSYLDKQSAATKPAPATSAALTESVPEVSGGMDTGASEIMAAAAPKKGKSIFERGVKMEPPTVDYEKNLETMRRSGSPESVMFNPGRQLQAVDTQIARGKIRQEAAAQKAAEKAAQEQATLEQRSEEEGYGPTDFVKDVGIGLVGKGGTGLAQSAAGLANIATGFIPGDENINPLQLGQWGKMMDKLGVDFNASNKFLTGLQSPRLQLQLGEVDKAQGFFGTIKALGVNPLALIDTVTASIPSIVASGKVGGEVLRLWISKAGTEAAAKGLTGKAAEEYIRNRALTAATLAAHASEGTLSAGSIAEEARAQGMEWEDYVAPAVAAGVGTALIGYGAGKAGAKFGIGDIETNIAARTAGVKGMGVTQGPALTGFFKEIIKEGFFEEMPQSAQEQIFGNLAKDRPWDEGVDKAAAQGLMAGLATAGGHNAAMAALRQNSVQTQLPADALSPLQNAQAITQTLPQQAAQPEATTEQPAATSRTLNDLAEQIAIERGIPLKNAQLLAQRRLDEATADKVEELTQVYVELGLPRKEAQAQAAIDVAKEEELATPEEDTAGETDVGQPIAEAGGVSPELAGQPNQVKPAEGFGEPATDGMVPTGEDVASTDAGEAVQPAALTFTTAKGSVYVVGADGKTSRTKNSQGRGQGTTYAPHMALYVQPGDHTEILSDMQGGRGANSVRLGYVENNTFVPVENMSDIPEGAKPFVGVFNKKKGTPVGLYPAVTTPEVGLHPVEKLYTPDGNANTHIGNEIIDIQPVQQPAPAQQTTTPTQQGAQVGTETPQAVQTTQKGQKQKPASAAGVTKAEQEAAEEQKLQDDYDRAQSIVNRSMAPAALLKGISFLRKAMSARYYFNKAMAFGPDFMYLANSVKNSIPALTTTYELTGKLTGMAADFLRAAGVMQKRVDDYVTKNPDKKDPLSRLVYMATVMRYDPADKKRKRRNVAMDTQFAELGEEGQKIYIALRDYYRDVADYYNDLLLEAIENLGIDPEEKKNLAILLRKEYEASKRITPYFPLVRLGDFWLRVGTGEDRELYTFESVGERDAFAAEMAKEFGTDLDTLIGEGDFAVGTQLNFRNEGSKGNTVLTALFDAIDKQPTTANDEKTATAQKETLKNVVFQSYLSAMPEQSFRKQFMEREDIPGFSTDITKNIAHTATKQALQLARMKYAPEIRRSLDEARRSLKFQPKGYDLEPYVNEAETRVNSILSSDNQGVLESVVTGINQISYVFLLSGPATALMDLINVPTRGLAVLAANHSSAGAVKELAKATALANRITEKRMRKNEEGVPTMLDDPTLSKELRYAIGEFMRSGVAQQTEVESLQYLGAKSTDVDAGVIKKTAQKIGRGASLATLGFSHFMSKLTREIVFTASYNLSRKEGKSPDEAIRIAIAETKEALGDFSVNSRPRYMQGELGRLVFNLKSFLVNTLLFELVNLKRMIKADNKEERIAATKKFLGLWATTSLALGQSATPLYTVIMSVLGLAFEYLKEDDWPEDMKAMNFEMWYRTIWIPEHLGDGLGGFVNHGLLGFTGWDLTYRASLDVVKQLMDWSQSLTPPGISVMVNMYEGMKKWERGEVEEGTKKMLPAIARGPYLSYLMATQGEKDSRGNQLADPDEIKLYEHAGQVLGFRPRVIGQLRRDNFELVNIERKIVEKRFDLLDRLDIARQNENWDAYDKAFDDIVDFNARHTKYKIATRDMSDSAKDRNKKRAESYRGIELTKKNAPMFTEAVVNTRRELDKRAQENEKKRE